MTENHPTDAGQKKTLLVVDDAPANIQVVQSILKDEYKIRVATSGEKALELVKNQPLPDLILLDVMMPGLDGYQVCAQLKAAPETRDIPVIFLTGLTDVDDETKGLEVGAVDYIRKPFSPAIVKARVRTQLLIRDSREQVNRQVLAVNHELEMARHIQLSILPSRPPAVPGLEIAARYLPMTTIAGDYYDYLRNRREASGHIGSRCLRARRTLGPDHLDAEDCSGRAGGPCLGSGKGAGRDERRRCAESSIATL